MLNRKEKIPRNEKGAAAISRVNVPTYGDNVRRSYADRTRVRLLLKRTRISSLGREDPADARKR